MLHVLAWKVANVSLHERPAKVQCPNISSASLPLPRPRRRIPSGPSRNFPKTVICEPGAQSPAIQFSPESLTRTTVFLVVVKRTALWAQRGRSTPSPSFEPNFSNYRLIPHCQRTHRLLLIQTGPQPSPTGGLDHGEAQSIQQVESFVV